MKELKTISKGKPFSYEGSLSIGTTIMFGDNRKVFISNNEWTSLLLKFTGKKVRIGASRTNPPKDSLGEWLINNITYQAIASYVAPILIHEDAAKQEGKFDIKFE